MAIEAIRAQGRGRVAAVVHRGGAGAIRTDGATVAATFLLDAVSRRSAERPPISV